MGCAYLVLRKSRYHFRMTIPPDVRGYVGQGEVHVSLREGDCRKARLKAGLFAFEVRRLIELVRHAVKSLNEREVRALVAKWRQQMVEKDSALRRRIEARMEPYDLRAYEGQCEGISNLFDSLCDSLAVGSSPDIGGNERHVATHRGREAAYFQAAGMATGEGSDDFAPLMSADEFRKLDEVSQRSLVLAWAPAAATLFQEKADASRRHGARLISSGRVSEPVADVDVTTSSATIVVPVPLADVWSAYLTHKRTTNRAWARAIPGKAKLAGETFMALNGADTAIRAISRDDFLRFEWFINRRPPRSNGRSANEDLLELERMLRASDSVPNARMTKRTVNEYFYQIAKFFDWARSEGYVDQHFAATMFYKIDENDMDHERPRVPWEDEEIRRILDPASLRSFVQSRTRRAMSPDRWTYLPWFLLLSCYTGARRAEVGGLMVDDVVIRNENGADVPVIEIRRNAVRPTLKNRAAERRVPVHPHLIELGLLDLVQSRREAAATRLMWNPESGDDVSKKVSLDVSAYLKHIGLFDPTGRKVLHSFRHSFKTKAIALMDKAIVDTIVGHAFVDSTNRSTSITRWASGRVTRKQSVA